MKSATLLLSALLALVVSTACSSKPTQTPVSLAPTWTASADVGVRAAPTETKPADSSLTLKICVELANVRTGPGTDQPILKQLPNGTSVKAVNKVGEWYYLGKDENQVDAYLHQSVVCGDTASATEAPTPEPGLTPASGVTPLAGVTPLSGVTPVGAVPAATICPVGCVEPNNSCRIKGNVSSKTGEKLYYLPSDADYEATVIDPDYGERWFCTEAEAQENGWKHASP